jgi:serine protease Do
MNTHLETKHLGWLLAVVLAPAALAAGSDEMQTVVPLPTEPPAVAWLAPLPAPEPLAEPEEQAQRTIRGMGGSYLGVDVKEIDVERAKALKLRDEAGVELTRVAEESPAAKAGLKAGDVVREFNGQRVEGTEQFVRLVRETPVGRSVKLLVYRNGSTQTIAATIGRRPRYAYGPDMRSLDREMERLRDNMERFHDFEVFIPDTPHAYMSWRSPRLGMEGESLEGQLADYFGVKEGVLVRSVLKDTPAEKAGLKAGDVVLKVDGTVVSTPNQISRALRGMTANKAFPLLVVRNRKEMAMQVTLAEIESGQKRIPRSRAVQHRSSDRF